MTNFFTTSLTICLIFLTNLAYTQTECGLPCNDTLDIDPAPTCAIAASSALNGDGEGYVCNLDSFCTSTYDLPPGGNDVFCQGGCGLQNPIWFSFVATSNFLDIEVCPNKCDGTNLLQWALYDQCNNLMNPVACDCQPGLPGGDIFHIMVSVIPGTVYYLVIDGYSGAQCGMQFKVNEGIDGVPVGDLISDVLFGPSPLCQGKTGTFGSDGYMRASDYEWYIDGDLVAEDVLEVTINGADYTVGMHDICMKATNDCSNGVWKEQCWQFEIIPQLTAEAEGTVCEDDPLGYFFRGNRYGAGTHEVIVVGPTCDTIYTLVVEELPKSTGPDVHLGKCIDMPSIIYDGTSYGTTSPFTELTYPNSVGCDSTVNLYVHDLEISGSLDANPMSLPCEGGSSILTANYFINFPVTDPTVTKTVTWFDVNHMLIEQNVDVITVTQPGTYFLNVEVTINNPAGAPAVTCTEEFVVTITVDGSQLYAPSVTPPPYICANKIGTFTVTDPFPPGTTYEWRVTGNGQIIQPDFINEVGIVWEEPGTYQVCVNPIDACGPAPETCVDIEIYPAPTITFTGEDSTCENTATLTATINGVPSADEGNLNYLWSVVSGPDLPGVSISQPAELTTQISVSTPGVYEFKLFVDYNNGGCGEEKIFRITFLSAPVITTSNADACNATGQPDPVLIDLNTLINSSVPVTGTWTLTSGPGGTPGGTLPNVDFTGVTQTGDYVYTFTPNQTNCTPQPVTVTITLNNCICPTIDIDAVGPTICNDGPTVDLTSLINPGTGAGTWTLTNSPAGQTVNLSNPAALDFEDQPEGTYEFTYTLTNNPVPNCPDKATTTVTIISAPTATVISDQSVCNNTNALGLPFMILFDTLVSGATTAGTWAYTGSGTNPATGTLPLLDFTDVTPGTYQFTYTISGGQYCSDVSYTTNIIVEDCKCPSVAVRKFAQRCSALPDAVIDLTPFKLTTQPGSWSLESQPAGGTATVTGNNFNGMNSVAGDYVIVFTLTNPSPDPTCPDTSQVRISLDQAPEAGTASTREFCVGDPSVIDIDDLLSGQDAGGTWAYTNSNGPIGSAFNATTGSLDIGQLSNPGKFDFAYKVSSGLGLCADDQSVVSVTINDLPSANAGADQTITCTQTTVTLNGSASSSGADITYEWTLNGNPTILGTSAMLNNVGDRGIYTLRVINSRTGCEASATVEVFTDNAVISAVDTAIRQISCFNTNDGAFTVSNVQGGKPPFQYAFDNGAFGSTSSWTNLGPGNHTMTIRDASGCEITRTFNLTNPPLLTVDAGPDRKIKSGDTVNITANTTIPASEVSSFTWTAEPETVLPATQNINVQPQVTTLYTIVAKDKNGCSATDFMVVSVKSVLRIYIPNAITPNNDNVNDVFYIQADANVKRIKKMGVYNRWGDVQYLVEDVPPNDPQYGWNGRFKGQDNTPAVFVYYAEIEYQDGFVEVLKGDVTVVK